MLSETLRKSAPTLTEALRTNGGFTFDPRSGLAVTDGFAVGLGRAQGVVKYTAPADAISEGDLATVVLDNLSLITRNPRVVLGGWVNAEGRAEIEPVLVVRDRVEALILAERYGEQAIGDLAAYARGEDGTVYVNAPAPALTFATEG